MNKETSGNQTGLSGVQGVWDPLLIKYFLTSADLSALKKKPVSDGPDSYLVDKHAAGWTLGKKL